MQLIAPGALTAESVLSRYDVVVCALGYESRARSMAEELSLSGDLKLALSFGDCKTHGYNDNLNYFTVSGFEIHEWSDEDFVAAIRTRIVSFLMERSSSLPGRRDIAVCLDISSFSRFRLASLVDLVVEVAATTPIRLHVMYSVACFSPPDRDDLPIRTAAPVTENYAGWSEDLDLPTVAIVGLGYEDGKALGAVEYLQADEIWVFDPHSPIQEYRGALDHANASLLDAVPNSKKIDYDVMNPHDLFVRLESLVYGLVRESRPVVLPFGPKIFTLVSLLVARLHPQLAVWRVSGGEPDEPTDRKASGNRVFVDFLLGEQAPNRLVDSREPL